MRSCRAARRRSRPSSTIAIAERARDLDARAAAIAGVVAGIVSTAAQIVLWLALTDALPGVLLRDAKLAAAIVMGGDILAAPADLQVMLAATAVHFALSVAYGLALGGAIELARRRAPLAVGAAFGLALFVVNMYGFTALFPWFAATRDPITCAAHLVFGVSAAATYRAIRRA